MKYKITIRDYLYPGQYHPQLKEARTEIKAWFFEIENGFVSIWTERNKTQIPDFYINANDVLTIKPIEGEEWPKQDFC